MTDDDLTQRALDEIVKEPGFDRMMRIGAQLSELYKVVESKHSVFNVKPVDAKNPDPMDFLVTTHWGKFYVTEVDNDVWTGSLPLVVNGKEERAALGQVMMLHQLLHASLLTVLDFSMRAAVEYRDEIPPGKLQ